MVEKAPIKIDKTAKNPVGEIAPRRREPSDVMSTFDDLLEDFRGRFRESVWTPWELAIKPYNIELPIRAAYSDLIDEGTKFLVRVEVPGIPRNKIDVTVTGDGIEISGETGVEKEEKDKNFIIRERSYSSIYKNLAFPDEVISDKAECILKNGILEVSVPKKTPTPEKKKHKVEVKEAK